MALLATTGLAILGTNSPATANGADQNVRNLQEVTEVVAGLPLDLPYTVVVSWDPPLQGEVLDYQLDIATTGAVSLPGFPAVVSASAIAQDPEAPTTSALTAAFVDLQPGSSYTVTVAAVVDGNAWPASTVTATTAQEPTDFAPGEPGNLALTPQQNAIVATWQAPTFTGNPALTGYRLEVWPPTVGPIDVGAGVTSHTISGLQQETNYTVSVVAVNSVGQSSATLNAVRTLAPVGVARLSGATATTSASTTTLSAQVADSGRPTSWGRVGFLVSRTDPPLLDGTNVTFLPAIGGFSAARGAISATTGSLAANELYFVRSVLEATYGGAGVQVSYGSVTPYAITDRTIRFTNLGAQGATGPNQADADQGYVKAMGFMGPSGAEGGTLEQRVEIRQNEPGIQRYLVDYPGAYRVAAVGAAGGGPADRAGRGAVVMGSFVFEQNDPLMVAVGQLPKVTINGASQTTRGGGGGTFLTRGTELADALPLLIAGGGGGAGSEIGWGGMPGGRPFQGRAHGRAPLFGDVEAPGQLGGGVELCYTHFVLFPCDPVSGGIGGLGGRVQRLACWFECVLSLDQNARVSAAGGGFRGNGQDGYVRGPFCPTPRGRPYHATCETGSGGRSFGTGARGGYYVQITRGSGSSSFTEVREGGFGGGGAGLRGPGNNDGRQGAGGGGYNGGGGSLVFTDWSQFIDHRGTSTINPSEAGGGGSYNAGASPDGVTGGGAAGAPGYLEMRLLAGQPAAGTIRLSAVRAGLPVTLTSSVASTGGDAAVERGFLVSSLPDPTLDSPDTLRLMAEGVGTGVFTADTAALPARTFLFVRSYVRGYGGVGYGPVRSLSTFRGVELTTAGLTGAVGPTQSAFNTAYAGTQLAGLVTTSLSASVPQGVQLVTVSASGRYRVQALGARGGVYTPPGFDTPQGGNLGGRGALVEATFELEAGETLVVLVGQRPDSEGGGGGGTFVARGTGLDDPDLQPLLVAGGGGAISFPFDSDPTDADATYPLASASVSAGSLPQRSGVNGGGGSVHEGQGPFDAPGWAGGGGGYSGNGADSGATDAKGGKAFLDGGVGGLGSSCAFNPSVVPTGGFGGGGAGATGSRVSCWSQGGNGGGYNGAGNFGPSAMDQYPRLGRGGGSLVTGADRGGLGGVNEGDGRVVLTLIPPPQPNPLLPGAGAPRTVTVAGASVERAPGSVLTWRNGVLVQVPAIAPAATVTSARTFIDSTVGSDTGGLLLDVVEGSGSSGAQIIGLLSQRNSDEPLPVPAGALTGVSTSAGNNEVRMLLAGTDDADQVRLRGNNGEPVAGVGGRISSIITGLPPGTQGEVSLRSTPRLLGTFTVDADGVASFVADVPGDLSTGSHTLVLAAFSGGQETEAVVSVGITVLPRAAAPGSALPPEGLGNLINAPVSGGESAPSTTTVPPPVTVPVRVTPPLPASASPEAVRQRGDEFVGIVASLLPAGLTPPVAVQATPTGAVISGLLTNPATGAPSVVPVQNIVMVQGDGTALMLASAGANGSSAALGADGVLMLAPGGRVGAAMAGFPAASEGQIQLFSTPTLLGRFITDANGVFAGDFAIPAGLLSGRHTLVFTVGGMSQSVEVVVSGDAPGGRLPATGTDGSATVVWALVLLAVGVLLVFTRRRRRWTWIAPAPGD